MGNCIISGKKKCKMEEVYTKRLSLKELTTNKNNVIKENSFNIITKDETRKDETSLMIDEIKISKEEDEIINQNSVKENVSKITLNDTNEENGNFEINLTYNDDVKENVSEQLLDDNNDDDDDEEEGEGEEEYEEGEENDNYDMNLTFNSNITHDEENNVSNIFLNDTNNENDNIDINLLFNSSTNEISDKSSSIKSLPDYTTPVGTPTLKIDDYFVNNDDRPIQPMPTPFRVSAVTPGRRIENFCDQKGRLRKDVSFQVYLAKKRKQNLFSD